MREKEPAAIAAVRAFVALVLEGEAPALRAVARALDELVAATQQAPESQPAGEEAEAPDRDASARATRLGDRFPQLGFYRVADPLEAVDAEPLVGDGIDDLADIVGDLEEVLWSYEAMGADDAHWRLRFLFGTHWGRHARELSLYLHALEYG